MRVIVSTAVHLDGVGVGYGIGLSDLGDRIEFIGDWRDVRLLREAIQTGGPQPAQLEEWQIIAVNGVVNHPLSREAMAARASFVVAAIRAPESSAE